MNEVDVNEIISKTEVENLHFVSAGDAQGQKELFFGNLANFFDYSIGNR